MADIILTYDSEFECWSSSPRDVIAICWTVIACTCIIMLYATTCLSETLLLSRWYLKTFNMSLINQIKNTQNMQIYKPVTDLM